MNKVHASLLGVGTGLALALATTSASADGYPRGSIKDAAPCCDTWKGFYLGIHGGYGWKDNDFAEFVGTNQPGGTQVFVGGIDSKGWLFGAHAGYNWQYGAVVGGLELDLSSTSIDGTSAPAVVTSPGVVEINTRADDVQWLGSARARLGYAPQRGSGCCGGNFLLYATGGLAWERFERTNTSVTTLAQQQIMITSTSVAPHDRFGWVIGAGAEAKLGGSKWVGRIEYLHYEFGTSETVNSQTIVGAAGTNFSEKADNQTIDVIRAGLSYKF
jgi:hypothetical protein